MITRGIFPDRNEGQVHALDKVPFDWYHAITGRCDARECSIRKVDRIAVGTGWANITVRCGVNKTAVG